MKYLFFDIECANCFDGKGKICEFGYIRTDEKFNVLEEDSIKINPCAPFDKKGFAIRGIHLEKPFEYYKTQPDFQSFYERIKALLQQPDQVVVGHGVYNDVKYLLDECNRYKLPHINFEFADTCELAKLILKRGCHLRLKDVYAEVCEAEDVVQNHRSLEDAYMTLEIAKHFFRELRIPFHIVIANYLPATGESYLGRIIRAGVLDLHYSRVNTINKKNKDLIGIFIKQDMDYDSETKYVLSNEFLNDNFPAAMVILYRLKERKELFGFKIADDCIYVLNDGENVKLDSYVASCQEAGIDPAVKTISFDLFLDSIGLTMQDLAITPDQVEELVGNMKCNKEWYNSYKIRRLNRK